MFQAPSEATIRREAEWAYRIIGVVAAEEMPSPALFEHARELARKAPPSDDLGVWLARQLIPIYGTPKERVPPIVAQEVDLMEGFF